MQTDTILLIIVLLTGFYMSWSIGANDVANAMGTSVGSKALTLRQAVILASILEFLGAFFFGSHVSETIQTGIIDPLTFLDNPMILVYGMLAVLLSAGIWLQTASYFGWPVSTTHTIVGAVVGFGLVFGGVDSLYWGNIFFIFTSWIFSPFLGAVLSYFIFTFLRTKIFYSLDPISSAKFWTPIIVFCVFFVLALILLFQGLENLEISFNFLQATLLSLSVAIIASAISFFSVNHIKNVAVVKEGVQYAPEVFNELKKAEKHLIRAAATESGISQKIHSMLQNLDQISEEIKPFQRLTEGSPEYVQVEKIFGYLQIFTAALMAFAHGANDVANAIGPLSAAVSILLNGVLTPSSEISPWILALGGSGIVLGLSTWGWRVIETIGRRITELTPSRGFSAEFGAATTIILASRVGMPISTTHTLVGAVIGVGLARGIGALNLITMRDIFLSWLVTIPAGALLTIGVFYLVKLIFG